MHGNRKRGRLVTIGRRSLFPPDSFEKDAEDVNTRSDYVLFNPHYPQNNLCFQNDGVYCANSGPLDYIVPLGFPRFPSGGPEIKFFGLTDTTTYTNASAPASTTSLVQIPAGTGPSQRIGRQVLVHAIKYDWFFYADQYVISATGWFWINNIVRVVVDTQSNGAQVTAAVSDGIQGDPSQRFQVLDSSYSDDVSSIGNLAYRAVVYIIPPEPIVVTYADASTAVPTTNNIYAWYNPQNKTGGSAPLPTWSIVSRVELSLYFSDA